MVQNIETETRRRGRPRAYDPDDALRRAMEAFWKTGYAGTSLDEISAATGMNRPSLRAAFGDKHTLYMKALDEYWAFKFVALREALQAPVLEQALLRAYEAALSIYFSSKDNARGCFVFATAITEAGEDSEIRGIISAGFEKIDADFEARFRQAHEAGELKAGADPAALSVLASGTMHTIAIRARAGVPREELEKLAAKVVTILCG